jgi:hypothetical protein
MVELDSAIRGFIVDHAQLLGWHTKADEKLANCAAAMIS